MDNGIRILVAEEDSSFLKMMKDSMKASGSLYHIQKVSSGGECLRMLQKDRFDILLLDHSLSDGEGLNWLRLLNELGIGIPTIFVTAKGDPRLAIEAMKEGVFDYINRSAECAIIEFRNKGRGFATTPTLQRLNNCSERCISKPPKSYHLKVIPSAFSTR